MNYRHPNRSKTGLKSNRVDRDRKKFIESFEVPRTKIGRFVDFGQSREFSEYYSAFEANDDNQYGLRKGWFSVVDAPLFVEYADITDGLRKMLAERSRPRNFGTEIVKVTGSISKAFRDVTQVKGKDAQLLNEQRQLALQKAIEDGDHAEQFSQYEFIARTVSEWETRSHLLHSQPRTTPTPEDGALLTYGFPIANSSAEMSLRGQIAEIVGANMPVPLNLLGVEMNVVPVLNIHCELSAMKANSPVIDMPPQEISLGPIEIHRF